MRQLANFESFMFEDWGYRDEEAADTACSSLHRTARTVHTFHDERITTWTGVKHHMGTDADTQTFLETYVIGYYLSILHHARTSITRRLLIVRNWRRVPARSSYIPSRRSLADCLGSSELLGLLMVAFKPPATLLGFLSPSLLPEDSKLPESRPCRD